MSNSRYAMGRRWSYDRHVEPMSGLEFYAFTDHNTDEVAFNVDGDTDVSVVDHIYQALNAFEEADHIPAGKTQT